MKKIQDFKERQENLCIRQYSIQNIHYPFKSLEFLDKKIRLEMRRKLVNKNKLESGKDD